MRRAFLIAVLAVLMPDASGVSSLVMGLDVPLHASLISPQDGKKPWTERW
jgi:hypothetical protein